MKNFILIDDDLIFNILSTRLIKTDYQDSVINTFTLATNALDYIEQNIRFDTEKKHIILLDINMPVMSGFEFLDKLTKLQLDNVVSLNVIMVTSSDDEGDKNKAFSYPLVTDFIRKPLSRNSLSVAISKYMRD